MGSTGKFRLTKFLFLLPIQSSKTIPTPKMKPCLALALFVFSCVAWSGAVTKASAGAAYVNGCRSQEECAQDRCCVFDWIPGVETDIGLCVTAADAGGVCSPACPRPSCLQGLECVVDNTDPTGKVHICQ